MQAGLAALAGLAPSPVLTARIDRAGPLAERCAAVAPAWDDEDWAALLDAVTVQETRLFRHPEQCLALAERLPKLATEARAAGRPLRLLSAGCATGEEAFTLAAIARQQGIAGRDVEVLGLDACRPALASATALRLSPGLGGVLDLVPPEYLRWLRAGDGTPRVHAVLGDMLRFHRGNLLTGVSGFGSFDVVFCRNVLIYLHEAARRRVLAHLVTALRPAGVLALGGSDRGPAGWCTDGQLWWRRDGS